MLLPNQSNTDVTQSMNKQKKLGAEKIKKKA